MAQKVASDGAVNVFGREANSTISHIAVAEIPIRRYVVPYPRGGDIAHTEI